MSSRVDALQALKARRQAAAPGSGTSGEAIASDVAAPASTPDIGRPVAAPHVPVEAAGPSTKTVEVFAWICNVCQQECIPIRSESRCLCGHRHKEHDPPKMGSKSKCKASRCPCPNFFYIVAEGSWVLRCRCKHKHIEHDPVTLTCKKCASGCAGFDSPWVCNCDHPWAQHQQVVMQREVRSLAAMMAGVGLEDEAAGAGAGAGPAPEVNNYDALKRGM